jgi:cell pole-organizing protein PopZ
MSSFDRTAGKNLDEILASIRKTLADETTRPQPNPPPSKASADPNPPASVNQNGSKVATAKIDEDLADLLAGGLGSSAPQSAPKETAQGTGDPNDPLWFLRPNGVREQASTPPPGGPASPVLDAPAGPDLSPERLSLAPLFVADGDGEGGEVHAAANGLASGPGQAKAASLPDPQAIDSKASDQSPVQEATTRLANAGPAAAAASLPSQVAAAGRAATAKAPVEAGPAPAKPEPVKPGPASGPTVASPAPAAAPLKPAARQEQPAPVGSRSARAAAPEGSPAASARLQGGAGASPIVHSAAATPRASVLNGVTSALPQAAASAAPREAASVSAVPAAQTQALEQIIEQLLEPLLRRWVEANLPRLVDAAIRLEVARALDARRANGQDTERKL